MENLPCLFGNQDDYNKAVKHLLAQKKQSMHRSGVQCTYRSEDGSKCAIGCLIPDTVYRPEFAGRTVQDLHYEYGYLFSEDANLEFLAKLQKVHDYSPPEDWARELVNLGIEFGFDTFIVGECTHIPMSKEAVEAAAEIRRLLAESKEEVSYQDIEYLESSYWSKVQQDMKDFPSLPQEEGSDPEPEEV